METLSLIVNAALLSVLAGVFGFYTKGRFDHLEARMDRLENSLRSDMNSIRSDLTQVALAVGVKPRAESGR
jgi:hypothetical protein